MDAWQVELKSRVAVDVGEWDRLAGAVASDVEEVYEGGRPSAGSASLFSMTLDVAASSPQQALEVAMKIVESAAEVVLVVPVSPFVSASVDKIGVHGLALPISTLADDLLVELLPLRAVPKESK